MAIPHAAGTPAATRGEQLHIEIRQEKEEEEEEEETQAAFTRSGRRNIVKIQSSNSGIVFAN